MAKIVSKLDLNKTPQLVDNNSLIFAKNIKLLQDGTIGPDSAITLAKSLPGVCIGHIVGINSNIYLFVQETKNRQSINLSTYFDDFLSLELEYYNITISNIYGISVFNWNNTLDISVYDFIKESLLTYFGGVIVDSDDSDSDSSIESYDESEESESSDSSGSSEIHQDAVLLTNYPVNTKIEVRYKYVTTSHERYKRHGYSLKYNKAIRNYIYKYDEVYSSLEKIDCNWSYSGGKIEGIVTTNNTNEEILTICEYFDDNSKLVPIKHINLAHCSENDDESIYTQIPNIPYTNLELIDKYVNPIPNGVYQFFIRYRIYKDFYTDWFPCSKECFAGNKNVTHTIQGSIQYVDITLNSNESFVFSVKHVLDGKDGKPNYVGNFKEYQIGFIVSHDDAVNARAWKHFPITTDIIYFDYDKDFIEEINIDDLLKYVYEISNVKNITYFRNKLYIANYIESNFNEDLSKFANKINCELVQKELKLSNYNISESINIDGKEFPIIPGTSLYNLGNDASVAIKRQIQETIITPQTNNIGTIFKAYYKVYVETDPTALYLKSGCDYSINNVEIPDNRYTKPYVLPTFCLIESRSGGSDKDFDKILIYNNQISNNSQNAGQLLYWDGNHDYIRLPKSYTPDTKVVYKGPNKGNENIYIHPLNYHITWIYGILARSEMHHNDQINDCVGMTSVDGWYMGALQPYVKEAPSRYYYDIKKADSIDELNEVTSNWGDLAEIHCSRDQLLLFISNNYPKYVLKEITIYSNNRPVYIITSENTNVSRTIYNLEDEGTGESSTITIHSAPYNDFRGICNKALENNGYISTDADFENWCLNYISPNIIDVNGNAYYNNNGVYVKISRIEIRYNSFNYTLAERSDFNESENTFGKYFTTTREIKSEVKEHRFKLYYEVKTVDTDKISNSVLTDRTLVPFTDYKFYVHYIKRNGVVTNGYPLSDGALYNYPGDNQVFDDLFLYSIIYPKFTNITIPNGYDGCFFSIEKVGNNIATCFNYREEDDERVVDCLEVDSMLYPLTDNITIIGKDGKVVTKKAKYYPSSTTNPPMLLGNAGCIRWNINDEEDTDESSENNENSESSGTEQPKFWVKILNTSESSSNNRLIKLTPYITETSFDNYFDLNIPGYACFICKPIDQYTDENHTKLLYVNGSDIYEKSKVGSGSEIAIELTDYNKLLTHVNTYDEHYYVYSNFNLSYLTLFDMSYKKLQYKRYAETDSQTGVTIESYKQMLFMLDSSILSYIYALPSMYKDYTRKLYSIKQDDKLYIFDNVIRSSDTNTDEYYKYIYKFDAVDYYAVPANKGKIVNLFSITQNIFIHCEHSLFKFSGVNTLTAKDTDVQLTENDVFETGITELFDSKYGYAGLQNKKHSIITFNVYVFYDKLANLIYGYFGDNNLVVLSQPIEKLIANKNVKDIIFANNELENRFFANIIYNDNSNICLSYNVNTKSFVSIHDFNFIDSFSSRSNTYFINYINHNIYKIDTTQVITNYSDLYYISKLFVNDMTNVILYGNNVENCLDIVCNIEYEKIKVLNYINWICNQINKYADDIDGVNLFVAEENISKYAGSKLRIYTDQCSTELINLENSNGEIYEQNTQPISSPNSYIYPRYNCGVWSLNYFRDVKNIEDIFKYKDAIPPTQQEEAYNRGLVNSDRSLIYGKYFVLRLIFRNKNFKLENINFNIQDYEKV